MMAKTYEVAFRLGAKLTSSFREAIREAQNSIKGLQDVANKMSSIGKTASLAITAPLVGIGTAAIKSGMDFEATMSKVQALSGATYTQMRQLEEQARELGKTTVFSASQAADAQAFLAMAGYDVNQILASMPGLLNLAAAGKLELGRAADITTNIMSAFGLEAEKTGHAADVLAAASANANTNVEQMGEAIKYLGPVANSLGWGLEESAAAVMVLSNAGIQGSMAGQAFASSLSRLAKPTREMENVMKKLGVSFFDAEGTMKSMPEVIAELEKATAGMTAEQRSAVLSTLFGAEAYKHWAVLLKAGSETLAANTKMLIEADGAAAKMAKTMTDNVMGDLNAFKSALSELGLQLYDMVQPALRTTIQYLTGITNRFMDLSPNLKMTAAAFAAVAASIGPLLVGTAGLIKAYGYLNTSFSVLKTAFLANPFGIVVVAIGALVAAFIYAWKHVDGFKERVLQAVNVVKDYVVSGFNVVADFVKDIFSQLRSFWEQDGEQIIQAVMNMFSGMKEVIVFIMPAILFVVKMVWSAIKQVITGALDVIMGAVKVFSGLFTGDFSKMWEGIKQVFAGGINFILGIMTFSFVGGIRTLLTNLVRSGWNLIRGLWSGIANIFKNMGQSVLNTTSSIVNGIINHFRNLFANAVNIFNTLRTFGASIWNAIRETILGTARAIWSGVTTQFRNLFSSVRNLTHNIKSTVTSIWNNIVSFLKNINLFDIGKNIVQGLINGIKSMGSSVLKAIAGLVPEPLRKAASGVVASLGIEGYAAGGIVSKPELAMVGEGGDTEAIIPWNNSQRAFDLWALTGQKIGAFNKLMSTPSPLPASQPITKNDNRSMVVEYKPTIIVQSDKANQGDIKRQVQQAVQQSYADFERWYKQKIRQEMRLSFNG